MIAEKLQTDEGWLELHGIMERTLCTRLDYYLGDRSRKEFEVIPLAEVKQAVKKAAAEHGGNEAQALMALIDVPVSKEGSPHPLVCAKVTP